MQFRTIKNTRLVDGEKIDNLPSDTVSELATKAIAAETYTKAETTSLLGWKQDTLVSGTNIKTVNGTSLLGSGDLVISLSGLVDSVNGEVGDVVLDADNIDDTSTNNKFTTQAEIDKLALIEDGAEVNITENVNAGTNITIDRVGKDITINSTGGGGATTLDDLTDVTITTPVNGQALTYNGTEWVNTTPAGAGDMLKSENLSGLANYATARQNLGLDTTANLTDSTDKRFMSDAQESKLDGIDLSTKLDKALTNLSGIDLNTITENGFYCADSTCTNLPEAGVKTRLRVNKDPSNANLSMQEAITTTTLISYVRTTANGGTSWTAWARVKATDETKVSLNGTETIAGSKTFSSAILSSQTTILQTDAVGVSGLVKTTAGALQLNNNNANGSINFRVNGGDRMTINNSGVVTIGASYVAPTLNNEVATKKYVDDNAGGGGNGPILSGVVAGEITTGTVIEIPVNKTITASMFRVSLKTLPTGADVIVKLYKNGVEDASVTIATGAAATNTLYQGTDTTFVSGSYVAGDVLKVSITQVGTTLAGTNLAFSLTE